MSQLTQSSSNFITRWKAQLGSADPKLQLVCLSEIVNMLNSVIPEHRNKVILLFVQSDIIHFINMSIQSNSSSLQITNKIVLYLSENEEFFSHYFSVVLKSYIRTLSFILQKQSCNKEPTDILDDVLSVFSILIRRASSSEFLLMNQQPLFCLINILHKKSLQKLDRENLMFIHKTLEIVLSSNSSKITTKVIVLLTRAKLQDLDSTDVVLTTAKILFNLLKFQRSSNDTSHLVENHLVDLFVRLMNFTLETNESYHNLEIFLNIFYYVITSDCFNEMNKFLVLKNFFEHKGPSLLINLHQRLDSNSKILKVKVKVLLAEICSLYLQQTNHQMTCSDCRKLCYKTVLSSDFNCIRDGLIIHEMDSAVLQEDLLLLIIILQSIDAEHIKSYKQVETYINLASILNVLHVRETAVEPSILNLVLKLFIDNWAPLETPNREIDVIKIATESILRLLPEDESPTLKVLQFIQNSSLNTEIKQRFMNLYFESPNMDYKELEKMSWNTEDLLEQLLAKTISKVAHNNISKILSMKVLTVDQYKKVLSKIVESLQEIHQKMSQELSIYHLEQMICNLLGVLKNIRQINYNSKFRDEAAGLMIDLMENKKRLSDGVYIQIMDVAMVILTKSPY